jgi:hypothetical protein
MTKPGARVYYIDPHPAAVPTSCHVIQNVATAGMAELKSILLRQ